MGVGTVAKMFSRGRECKSDIIGLEKSAARRTLITISVRPDAADSGTFSSKYWLLEMRGNCSETGKPLEGKGNNRKFGQEGRSKHASSCAPAVREGALCRSPPVPIQARPTGDAAIDVGLSQAAN